MQMATDCDAARSGGGIPEPQAGSREAPLSELCLCLSRAFLPPPAALSGGAWCAALAEDLEELGVLAGTQTGDAVAALRRVGTGPLAAEPWLVEYSRLFLVPPVRVPLNAGIYLEGALGGTSSQMLAQCYARAGYARQESFADLPDHVGMQLEFVAALLERADRGEPGAGAFAREFLRDFVDHWAGPLRAACSKCAAEGDGAAVYAALAGLVEGVVACSAA